MDALDALFKQIDAENADRYAKEPAPTKAAVKQQAAFLKGWSKGKLISKVTNYSDTFYKCGNWSTKISPKMAEALIKQGYATGNVKSFTVK